MCVAKDILKALVDGRGSRAQFDHALNRYKQLWQEASVAFKQTEGINGAKGINHRMGM